MIHKPGDVVRYRRDLTTHGNHNTTKGRPIPLFELAKDVREKHNADLFDTKRVLFVRDLTEEDLQPTI